MDVILTDELGHWFVFNADGKPFAGPYDDLRDAQDAYPDAEVILPNDDDDED